MNILENFNLKKYNTFGINASARFFIEIKNIEELQDFISSSLYKEYESFVLGGGSNILLTDDFDGIVIYMNNKGINIIPANAGILEPSPKADSCIRRNDKFWNSKEIEITNSHNEDFSEEYVFLEAASGEEWHRFVEICLNTNYFGLENLALIPGKVGAAPVQNIGAYGAEQSDFFYSLKGIDLTTNSIVELNASDCDFSYRSSIFKKDLKNKFIVTSVTYKLNRKQNLNLSYPELAHEIKKFAITEPDARYVFDTVCRIRRKKLPDPADIGNAGSFFKNPIIKKEQFVSLSNKYPFIPAFEMNNGMYKISAAWLIEQCGWKGKRINDAGVSEHHSLILLNHGNAKGREITTLAENIKNSVREKYNITLETEVEIL